MEASKIIDEKIASIPGWRGKMMKDVRTAIRSADPEIVEEWKWMGTPVWNCHGILCVANAHKDHVKVTFMYGAKIKDPKRIFNAGLEGNARRAIDLHEGDKLDAEGLKGLIRAAIALNREKPAARKATDGLNVTAKVSKKKSAAKKSSAKTSVVKKRQPRRPRRKSRVTSPTRRSARRLARP